MAQVPTIAILERHRGVGVRIARVAAGASSGSNIVVATDLATLAQQCQSPPTLLLLDEADLDACIELANERFPLVKFVVWTNEFTAPLLARAQTEARISSVIGWPSFRSMPRPWELAYVIRHLTTPQVKSPHINDLLLWGASSVRFRPNSTGELDLVLGKIAQFSTRLGIAPRVAERIGECAHELLMNAMYDAPIDAEGNHKYALDRTQNIRLDDADIPTLRLASDGLTVGLEINDRFGGLTRNHVIDGILRGLKGATADNAADILDTCSGGAGLGMVRLFNHAALLMVDIRPGEQTRVTWLYELDVSARDFRSLPKSIHFFQSDS